MPADRVRMIATVAELDALPNDSVILDDGWYPKVKGENGKWWRPDCPHGIAAEGTVLPTLLLWTPEDDCTADRVACDVVWEDPTANHVHTCMDFPDHSERHHLCAVCGWAYG